MHTAVRSVGSFVSVKRILNQIQRVLVAIWSPGISTDCDQQDERQAGWWMQEQRRGP